MIVANVLTVPVPADSSRFLGLLDGIEKRLLTLVVGALRLVEIYYVDSVSDVFANVCDFEVVPLSEIGCVVVVLENQIVLVVANGQDPSQVA